MPDNVAREPGTIQLTETQANPYNARPEDFPVREYSDPISEPYHNQGTNDPEVEKKSNEAHNRGSVRAEGNVDHAGRPHTLDEQSRTPKTGRSD